MEIAKILKEYPKKKAKVESTDRYIETLQKLLTVDNIEDYMLAPKNKELGMPFNPNRKHSTVENQVEMKQLSYQMVKDLIAEEITRIYWIRVEVEQVENAIINLNEKDRFLVTSRYIEDDTWSMIESKYNFKFTEFDKDFKTAQSLKHDLLNVLNYKLIPILEGFYRVYGKF